MDFTSSLRGAGALADGLGAACGGACCSAGAPTGDRKSTRLNSSHSQISYAVFCLKKKKKTYLSKIVGQGSGPSYSRRWRRVLEPSAWRLPYSNARHALPRIETSTVSYTCQPVPL